MVAMNKEASFEMSAILYLKEKERMKNYFYHTSIATLDIDNIEKNHPEEAVRIVEEWSKAHPIQTNADKIKEVFAYCPAITKNQYGDEYLHIPKGWLDAPYEAPKEG